MRSKLNRDFPATLFLALFLAATAALVILAAFLGAQSGAKPAWKSHNPFDETESITQLEPGEDLSKIADGKYKGVYLRRLVSADELRRLCDSPDMQRVALKGWGFSEEHFKALADAPHLRACELFEVRLDAASLEPFFGNKGIEWFSLGSQDLHLRHFEVLASMPNLREIWIGYVHCEKDAIEWFRKTRPDVHLAYWSY